MALEGTFKIVAQTPMGEEKADLIVKTEGNTLVGTMGGDTIAEGSINGDCFTFKAKLPTPMGKIKMTFEGKIDDENTISGTSKTMFGKVPFQGTRA